MKAFNHIVVAVIVICFPSLLEAQKLTQSQLYPVVMENYNYNRILNGTINKKIYVFENPFIVNIGALHEEFNEPNGVRNSRENAKNHFSSLKIVNPNSLLQEKTIPISSVLANLHGTTAEYIHTTDLFIRENRLVAVYTIAQETDEQTFYAQELDESGTAVGKPHKLITIDIAKGILAQGDTYEIGLKKGEFGNHLNGERALSQFRFMLSPDKNNILAFHIFRENKSENSKCKLLVFDKNFTVRFEKIFQNEYEEGSMSIVEIAVDNNQQLYLLTKRYKTKQEIKQDRAFEDCEYKIHSFNGKNGESRILSLKQVDQDKNRDIVLSLNQENEVLLAGTYASKAVKENRSAFAGFISSKLKSSESALVDMYRFPIKESRYDQFYENIRNLPRFAAANLYFRVPSAIPRKIIPLRNGRFFIVSQAGINQWVSFPPPNNSVFFYYCFDITISLVNQEGKIEWLTTIPARQNVVTGFNGYIIWNNTFGFTCSVDEKENISIFYSNSQKNYANGEPKQKDLFGIELNRGCEDCDGLTYCIVNPEGKIIKNTFLPWDKDKKERLLSRRGMVTIDNKHYLLAYELKKKYSGNDRNEHNYTIVRVED